MQQQQGGNGADNSLDFLWLVVILVVSIGLIWYFGKNHIANAVFFLRDYEIIVIQYILTGWTRVMQFLHLPMLAANTENLTTWQQFMAGKPTNVSFSALTDLSTAVGNYYRIPVAIVLVALGIKIYFSHLTSKFRTTFSMQRLRNLERENWPQITPVVNLDLVKQDLDQGPWAMAMTPLEFVKQNKLIQAVEKAEAKTTVTLVPGEVRRVIALQLGPLWQGPSKLPIHMQALLAVFAARANRDREGADAILNRISISANSGKLDFTGVRELLDKHVRDNKLVAKAINQHAYVYTVMASMLELARTDGVLACADFLWLKPVDRRLWYMLNSVGRQTAVTEIAGAFAHWLAEKKVRRPLKVPMVDEAVRALEVALQEIIYEPEEE